MDRGLTGYYTPVSTIGEKCQAFVPNPLPPDPPLQLDADTEELCHRAMLALGRLDGVTLLLPDPELFLYSYIRKEAVLSSQIEGTQSSLSDLLLFESEEIPGVPLDDVQEVSSYVAALNFGLGKLHEGIPISLRLLCDIHAVLLSSGRGSEKQPGEFRRSQNWIGGTRPGNATFVPPPPDMLFDCMGRLEKFLHNDPVKTPLLLKMALAHVQFETIHPFLDGNGRLGRLLITVLLCAEGELTRPMLYLSLYFKKHRDEYYRLLQDVRLHGTWETWVRFFFEGVMETANQAFQTARQLQNLFDTDRTRISRLGGRASSAIQLHHIFQSNPILTVAKASQHLGKNLSLPTIESAIQKLQQLGIVREISGRKRNRLFCYEENLKILSEGTEPIRRFKRVAASPDLESSK